MFFLHCGHLLLVSWISVLCVVVSKFCVAGICKKNVLEHPKFFDFQAFFKEKFYIEIDNVRIPVNLLEIRVF